MKEEVLLAPGVVDVRLLPYNDVQARMPVQATIRKMRTINWTGDPDRERRLLLLYQEALLYEP
jgi:hypothetical protein